MPESEKPASAVEALEAASARSEAADSSPAEDNETAQPSQDAAAATEQPSDGPAADSEAAESAKGPIPFDRHQSIIQNAREKARQEALDQWRQQYGWAESFDRRQWEEQARLLQEMRENPIDFYRKLGRELEAHPHLGPQLKQPAQAELPKPSLRSEDGRSAYTAEEVQQILDIRMQQWHAQQAEQLQGIAAELQQLKAVEQQRSAQGQAQEFTNSLLGQARKWPHFKEHEKDIHHVLAGMSSEQLQQLGGVGAGLREAYIQVLQGKVLPKLTKQSKDEALTEMQKKAGAGTVDPSSPSAGATKRPSNRKELARFLSKRAGVA